MSDEITRNISDNRSFEERVFARFDSLDSRIQVLESQGERRALETKPIWERALAEIGEVKVELGGVKTEFGGVKVELGGLKTELGGVKVELGGLITELGGVKVELGGVKTELSGVKVELGEVKTELGDLKVELVGVKERLGGLEDLSKKMLRKIDILNKDMLTLRSDQLGLEDRLEKLELANVP